MTRSRPPAGVPLRAALFALLALSAGCGPRGGPVTDIRFFYQEICPSCDTYLAAERISRDLFQLQRSGRYSTAGYNLINPDAAAAFRETIEERGLPDISRSLPVLVIDNDYLIGYQEIEDRVLELLEGLRDR